VYYATHILKKQKIAVFYEESEWGRVAKDAVEHSLAAQGIALTVAAPYQPGTVNVHAALAQMQHAEPHVVICIASARPAYNFIREAINQQLHYVSFLGISRLTNIAEHLRTSRGITLVTSSVVPNPHNSQLPIVDEYRQDMQRYLPNKGLSTYSLEGYINSMLLSFYLEQMPTGATVNDLWQTMHQTRNLNFKGLDLEQHNNTLSHTIWINEGSGQQWHEYVVRDS
jgi:ABC-type branched-subunit amino acid transport system substrate-binding protein